MNATITPTVLLRAIGSMMFGYESWSLGGTQNRRRNLRPSESKKSKRTIKNRMRNRMARKSRQVNRWKGGE